MTSSPSIANLIQGFKLSCQTEGKSPKTVEWYLSFLERFRRFLASRKHPPAAIEDIDKSRIREFILYLQAEARCPRSDKPLSSATVQGYVRTLKAFFAWVAREDYLEVNPMAKIPVPRATTKVINTLSGDQIAQLLGQCGGKEATAQRDFALILLLLDCGIRVSEAAGVEVGDVDLAQGCIKLRCGKGNKERVVPIGSLVQKALWRYINAYRAKPLTNLVQTLFLNGQGRPLTKNGIQQMLHRYGQQAGLTGVRCSPHTLRHTFAKNYLMNGGDIFSLQKILGHSSLASVRIYLNLFAIDIKKQHERFSPVDNMADLPMLHRQLRGAPSGKH